MDNHYFTIGGKIYRQNPTGSIGMDLTGELAAIVMIIWDRKFLQKCQKLGISLPMYTRYVDDTLNGLKAISNYWNYDKKANRMIYEKNTTNSPTDKHTMCVLSDIASSITITFLILERSAIPNKIKRETLLQEGLRRLRNID